MHRVTSPFIAIPCSVSLVPAADKKSHETCFLAVPFAKGASAAIHLDNKGKASRDVTIQRFSATGKLLDTVTTKVAGRSSADVRLDLSADSAEFGWFRSVEKGGNSVLVSSTFEYLSGNALNSLPELAVYRHPLSARAVQDARLYSIRHKYTYDVFALRGVAYFFVNLSDYPVAVGMCQENYPDCTSTTLDRTVQPMATIAFPIDQQKRFLVVESEPGYSAGTALAWTEGLTKVFGASSSITFGPEN